MFRIAMMLMSMCVLSLYGCKDDPEVPQPAGDASATITKGEVDYSTIEVTVTPNEHTKSFSYAIGTEADLDAFKAGTLEGIINKNGKEAVTETFSELTVETEYTIFVQCVNNDDITGEVATLKIATLPLPANASLAIELTAVHLNEISAKITPDEHTVKYSYAIGTIEDLAAFEAGTLEGIQTVEDNTEATYQFPELDSATEYVVFAQGTNRADIKGEVVCSSGMTLIDIFNVEVSYDAMNLMYCTVTTTPMDAVDHYFILSAGEDVYFEFVYMYEEFFGMTEDEMIQELGMECTGETTNVFGLSGEPNFKQMMVIAMYDAAGELQGILYDKFTTPEITPGLPLPEPVSIVVSEETATSARVVFTPGANTAGYFQLVFKAADYDEVMDDPELTEEDKTAELRSFLLFANYMMIEEDDYVWPGLIPDTEYVALARPFNDNGEAGWGDFTAERFATLADASAPQARPSGRDSKIVKSLTKELLESMKR